MFQKILHFIKYHNAFAIIFMLVFVGFSISLAASPDFRENFVSSQETIRSVNNGKIISAGLDNLNFKLQIKSVTEDEMNYYIVYTYQTLVIKDYIWQEVEKETTLTVNKKALGGRDLGLYVAEELGEVIEYELSYLKEVQQIEKQKGLTQKVVATQYAGLIGQFLEPKEKVFPGYEPVVQEVVQKKEPVLSEIAEETLPTPTPASVQEEPTPQQSVQIVEKLANEEQIRQIVSEMLSQYQGRPAPELESELAPIPETESEPEPQPEPEPESRPPENPVLENSETSSVSPETPVEPVVEPQPEQTPESEPEPIPAE